MNDILLQTLNRFVTSLVDNESAAEIDSYRVLHGRGRCYPGLEWLTIDFYQPVLVFVVYQEQGEDFSVEIRRFFAEKLSSKLSCVAIQWRCRTGAPLEILAGSLPEELYAARKGLHFALHLGSQQNLGYFLDIEAGRCWLESNASDKNILNLFSYTCAFSVVSVSAGARKVVNVDMSSAALNWGRKNHALNGLPKNELYLAENILKSWGRIKKQGPYDIVIIDPPSYQKGSFVAEKDYEKIVRRLPELMPQGGLFLACLNSPELGLQFLKNKIEACVPSAQFLERLDVSGECPDVDSDSQLKLLVYQLQTGQL